MRFDISSVCNFYMFQLFEHIEEVTGAKVSKSATLKKSISIRHPGYLLVELAHIHRTLLVVYDINCYGQTTKY